MSQNATDHPVGSNPYRENAPAPFPLNLDNHAKEATLREVQAILHQSILDRGNEAIGEIRWMKDAIVKEVVRDVMKELIAELDRRDDLVARAAGIAAAIKDKQP